MSDRRRGLGKGLGALIPPAPMGPVGSAGRDSGGSGRRTSVLTPPRGVDAVLDAADTLNDGANADFSGHSGLAAHYDELPLDAIAPNPRQPRQAFDEDALAELVHSLREIGLLQPVVVRPIGAGGYELVAGERRWRAARAAGFDVIPAIVRQTADDHLLRDALLENLHRAQLNPLEEAAAYDQLLKDFGCTQDELATRIGRSRPQVSNTLRLLRLPPEVARRVAAGVLSAGHARALLALPDDQARETVAKRIVAEGLSVRAVEELVAVGAGVAEERTSTGGGPAARSKPAPRTLDAVADALSERLETRVSVSLGQAKGTVAITFASLPDLGRILDVIAPDVAAELSGRTTGAGSP